MMQGRLDPQLLGRLRRLKTLSVSDCGLLELPAGAYLTGAPLLRRLWLPAIACWPGLGWPQLLPASRRLPRAALAVLLLHLPALSSAKHRRAAPTAPAPPLPCSCACPLH